MRKYIGAALAVAVTAGAAASIPAFARDEADTIAGPDVAAIERHRSEEPLTPISFTDSFIGFEKRPLFRTDTFGARRLEQHAVTLRDFDSAITSFVETALSARERLGTHHGDVPSVATTRRDELSIRGTSDKQAASQYYSDGALELVRRSIDNGLAFEAQQEMRLIDGGATIEKASAVQRMDHSAYLEGTYSEWLTSWTRTGPGGWTRNSPSQRKNFFVLLKEESTGSLKIDKFLLVDPSLSGYGHPSELRSPEVTPSPGVTPPIDAGQTPTSPIERTPFPTQTQSPQSNTSLETSAPANTATSPTR